MDVVTVGDVMIDVRVDSDGLEEGGDVHGRVLVRPGGSAANAASTARRGSGLVAATRAPSRAAPASSRRDRATPTNWSPPTSTSTTTGITRNSSTVRLPRSDLRTGPSPIG